LDKILFERVIQELRETVYR